MSKTPAGTMAVLKHETNGQCDLVPYPCLKDTAVI